MNSNTQTLGFWNQLFGGNLEHNRYAIITMVLLIVGCLGGLTVGFGAINSITQLIFVVIPTMVTLSLLLAVAPVKQILIMAGLTVFIDAIILIINAVG